MVWEEVRVKYSEEDWQNQEEHYESILVDALRYLSRISIKWTTHSLLKRNGFDGCFEDELLRRGFIEVEAESSLTPTRIYTVNLPEVEKVLKSLAATDHTQQRLCLA